MSDQGKEGPAEPKTSQPMTDKERLALCQKLDKELDDFIDGLEKKRYTEGWPEDRWQEEMDKHPFFMKQAPNSGEMSPLVEGLAKLKYDADENTPCELANNYKEDGNFNFKHKNYRLAMLGYTEGIKVKCGDPEIEASLYNNRAAAHWQLKNYRSALSDSEKALTFNPSHNKARLRAAKSAIEISKHDTCIQHCEKYLESDPNNKEVLDLLKKVKHNKILYERDQRKKLKIQSQKQEGRDALIKAILDRGIKLFNYEDDDDFDLSKLEPNVPGGDESMVHLENGVLKWPVLLLYPEFQITDFLKDCPENVPLACQLEQVFPAPWDEGNRYKLDTINVYFEGSDQVPHIVDPNKSLGEIIQQKYFVLKSGTPTFVILERGSKVEGTYIQKHHANQKS